MTTTPTLPVELAESSVALLVLGERYAQLQRLQGLADHAQASERAVLRFRWALRRLVPYLGEIEAAESMARRRRPAATGAADGA